MGKGYNTVDLDTGTKDYVGPSELTKGNHDGMPPRDSSYLSTDERGHIQASSLSGDNSKLNIAPQAKDLNHGAYPFSESQGQYARVQTMDDEKWSIINIKEEQLLSGFDTINELSYCTTVESGVKNGKAVLFSLDNNEQQELYIICEYAEYVEIDSSYAMADIVFVKAKDGRIGVINANNGDIVVPVEYEDIKWGYMDSINDGQMWFNCEKVDGTYDIHYWNK